MSLTIKEKMKMCWSRIGAHRRRVLNPAGKVLVLVVLLVTLLLPCPLVGGAAADVDSFGDALRILGYGFWLILSAGIYGILSFNDHKLWLVTFLMLQTLGSMVLVTFVSCNATNDARITGSVRAVVRGLTLKELWAQRYRGGSFILEDGQAVLRYDAILHAQGQNFLMAPLVPSSSEWNSSRPIFAWALAPIAETSDGGAVIQDWADPNMHEGVIHIDSTTETLVQMMLTEFPELKAKNNSIVLFWRPLYHNTLVEFLFDEKVVISFCVFVMYLFCVGLWVLDYTVYRWLTVKEPETVLENVYLLRHGKEFHYYSYSPRYV